MPVDEIDLQGTSVLPRWNWSEDSSLWSSLFRWWTYHIWLLPCVCCILIQMLGMKLEGHSVHIPDNNNTLCTHSVITNGLCSLSCHQGLGWMPSQFVLHCCSCIVTNEYHIIAETIAEWHCLLFSLFQKWLGGSLFWGVLSGVENMGFS